MADLSTRIDMTEQRELDRKWLERIRGKTMITSRNDVKRDKRPTKLGYDTCSTTGYSTLTLSPGDCFRYWEPYTDKTKGTRLAKCHGRIKPNDGEKWFILAQAANDMMSFTYERWIEAKDVIETLPAEHVKKGVADFFTEQIALNGY